MDVNEVLCLAKKFEEYAREHFFEGDQRHKPDFKNIRKFYFIRQEVERPESAEFNRLRGLCESHYMDFDFKVEDGVVELLDVSAHLYDLDEQILKLDRAGLEARINALVSFGIRPDVSHEAERSLAVDRLCYNEADGGIRVVDMLLPGAK